MHPVLKWSLIIFAVMVLVAPVLAADTAQAIIAGVQGAIESLKTFGDAVVPK